MHQPWERIRLAKELDSVNTETHRQLANGIWSICNLLRGLYKRNECPKVILPLTVLRRFDCLLSPNKPQALDAFSQFKGKPNGKPESIIRSVMQSATAGTARFSLAKGQAFAYNLAQQHPPRLSTMRTMGGYFFAGAEK